ncbi:MAG: right-handed parallel beta-helix repeat-containing protein [Phycisphaeraceae bacterium]
MKRSIVLLWVLLLFTTPLSAATYYLDAIDGDDDAGDGSAASPWASMERVFQAVEPGDTVLLRPGRYGSVAFGEDAGVGSDAGHVTYKADPDTTTPRPDTWYEDGLPRPDADNPDGQVIFDLISFDLYSEDVDAETKTGTPTGHYITIEGFNVVDGNINFKSYVSDVVVRDCNVFGQWGDYSTDITSTGLNLYRAYYWGSNYRNILLEDNYVTHCRGGVILLGNFHNVTVRGNHFEHFASTAIGVNGEMDNVLIEGNHAHGQVVRADTKKHTTTVAAPDAGAAGRRFTIADDIRFHDYATITDADTGDAELRVVTEYDSQTRRLTLDEPLPFDLAPGDEVVLWDGTHGSGVAVRSSNFTLRGNRIHNLGGTRGIYFYTPGDAGYHDVVIENNLIYATLNQYTVDLNRGLGDRCVIRNNTFVGRVHPNFHRNGDTNLLYGFGLFRAAAAPDADASSIVVANNLIVGTGSAPQGATVKNNIVYASSDFEQDDDGPNAGNRVYHDADGPGRAARPFHGSGRFFVGGEQFEELAFQQQHGENFNAAFRLVESAAAVGAADPEHATPTDITGQPRDDAPDVGAHEYRDASR